MKKKLFLCVLSFVLAVSAVPVHAEAPAFMSGFEDLPLMPGLIQQDDASVSFDTPAGRIIEAYAESPEIGRKKILDFYSQSLPQLGWKKRKADKGQTGSVSYLRDGEVLDISIEDDAPILVRFELTTQ